MILKSAQNSYNIFYWPVENNRGITLLPVFYKVFEMLILQREHSWLENTLDELQGAAQENCSCQHTSLMMQEAISYNLDLGESVYGALCDIMKAFDSVWINGLLYKLQEYGIDIKSWKLIQNGAKTVRVTGNPTLAAPGAPYAFLAAPKTCWALLAAPGIS